MSFIERTCKTPEEKHLCSLLITKLIPDMQSLDFASIQNTLHIVEDGMTKFHDSRGSRDQHFSTEQIGPALEQYVKLKLKKVNIEMMMETACEEMAKQVSVKRPKDAQDSSESLSDQINVLLPERSAQLKKLKKLLSLYRRYRKDFNEFQKAEPHLTNTKQIIPPVVISSFWSTKKLNDPASIVQQFDLDTDLELKFLELVMKRIQQLEGDCMVKSNNASENPLHTPSSRLILSKASQSPEQTNYMKYFEDMFAEVEASKNYEPKMIETEFT